MLQFDKSLSEQENDGIVTTIIVWDGKPKSEKDITLHFKLESLKMDIVVEEINSLD
jgi:hypothetical protein